MSYDEECYKLAQHFLGNGPELHALADRLAQEVQQRIEDWLEYERDRIAKEIGDG